MHCTLYVFLKLQYKQRVYHMHSFLPFYYCRAAQTCRYWRILAEDNLLWREKCKEAGLADCRESFRCPPFLRWISWTAFLVEVSGHKLVFVKFSALIILFYKILFMNEETRLFLFPGFFCTDFWNPRRVWYSLKSTSRRDAGTVNSMEQKTRVFC